MICLNSVPQNVCVVGRDWRSATTNLPARKSLFALHVQEYISNLYWYKLSMQPLPLEVWLDIQTQRKETSPYCHCTNDSHCYFPNDDYGAVWNPTDLFKVDMLDSLKEWQLSEAVKQATKFIEKQGFIYFFQQKTVIYYKKNLTKCTWFFTILSYCNI